MADTASVSRREAEVLAALADQLSNAQIAHRLHISVRTVESHVSSLLRKFGAADRHALAKLARPAGSAGPAGAPPSSLESSGACRRRGPASSAGRPPARTCSPCCGRRHW